MLSVAEGLLLFVATTDSVLGILGNGFIALVNCIDCVRRRKFSKISFILTGLAISRICIIWIMVFDAYIKLFSPHMVLAGSTFEYLSYLWLIINHLSIWFATSLNIFYFLKIANFSHPMFLWLKRRIDSAFIVLLGCLFVSWLSAVLQFVRIVNKSKILQRNSSWQVHLQKSEILLEHILVHLGALFFFTVTLVTCFLLLASLWRHTRHIHSSALGLRDFNTEAHVKAMKVVVTFIILFALYFMGMAMQMICFFLPENRLLLISGLIATSAYPCYHSFILILASNQLKQASLRVLQQFMCCDRRRN